MERAISAHIGHVHLASFPGAEEKGDGNSCLRINLAVTFVHVRILAVLNGIKLLALSQVPNISFPVVSAKSSRHTKVLFIVVYSS